MDKQTVFGIDVEVFQLFKKIQVALYDVVRDFCVGVYTCLSSVKQPCFIAFFVFEPTVAQVVVVAPEEDAAVCRVQMNQVVDNLWRLAPSVYIISQKD